jgi:hypothetical protein
MSFPVRRYRYLRGVLMLGRSVPRLGELVGRKADGTQPVHKLRARSG